MCVGTSKRANGEHTVVKSTNITPARSTIGVLQQATLAGRAAMAWTAQCQIISGTLRQPPDGPAGRRVGRLGGQVGRRVGRAGV